MSSDDFRRSVRSTKHDRAAGDAPNIGRVARMPGTGLPKGERRKRRRSESKRGGRVGRQHRFAIALWSFLVAGLVFAALGLAVWVWILPKLRDRGAHAAVPAAFAEEPPKSVGFPRPSEEESVRKVRQALEVRDAADVTEFFRIGRSSPERVVEFLSALEPKEGRVDRCEWIGSVDANGLTLEAVLVIFESSDRPRNRMAMLVPDAAGVWKVDFDAFARTAVPSWEELLGRREGSGVARVHMAADSYFNGAFRDESQWACYGLACPDSEEIVMGYARRGTPQSRALEAILGKGGRISRATVELRRVEGGDSKQFEIARVLAEDWVEAAEEFDAGFR